MKITFVVVVIIAILAIAFAAYESVMLSNYKSKSNMLGLELQKLQENMTKLESLCSLQGKG